MNRYLSFSLSVIVCLALWAGQSIHAETYNITITPKPDDANGAASYRLWIPPELETVRGIMVRQHGCGAGARKFGLEHADDPQWQALAKKWDCALLGSQLWAPEEDCSTWTIPQDGSARAFFAAITHFAEVTNHPEIEFVPWCLWGHSGGAMWVCNMTYLYPERVIATFPRSGGLRPIGREYSRSQPAQFDDSSAAFQVPILFCFGEKEDVEGTRFFAGASAARQLFEHGRKQGALWSLAVHPGSDHENSNSRLLAIRFFDACLKQRLPAADSKATAPIPPFPASHEKSWFGNLETYKIHRERDWKRDASTFAWFPDTHVARAWQEFSKRGSISDKSPPPPPQTIQTKATEKGIELSWKADADVESGIASFRVYRGEKMLAEIRGKEDKRWNPHSYYHAWNYSDQPLLGTEFPAKRYVIKQSDKSDQPAAEYFLTTVNQAGLESEKVLVP